MQLICVSRGSYGCGKAFAESLARKLGCACIGREELLEKATLAGIPVGKLEMACLKPEGLNERMLLVREHYQAFVTSYLAERALAGPLVYHGLTGHLLFKGVSHILRIRVVTDMETRIKSVQERLGLNRAKAQRYIEELEEDRKKWVKTFYNTDWDQSRDYDFTINVEHTNVENVASSFCSVALLPEFRETPASRAALQDLLLANQCRLALATNEQTHHASFQVQADHGKVSVSYLPQHSKVSAEIAHVLQQVSGVKQIFCTMASSRILWIQEQFDPKVDTFKQLVELASKWGAAIELLRLKPSETAMVERAPLDEAAPESRDTGGVEDDLPPESAVSKLREGGVEETFTELARLGKAAGRVVVQGTVNNLLSAIDRSISYSLVVIGDVFLEKGKAARTRMSRELATTVHERLRVAVVQAEEMKQRYLFGPRQLISMLTCLAVTVFIYFAVFSHQQAVLDFLTRTEVGWRIAAAASVAVFIPIVAYFSGKAVHYTLKLIKME
jgi:hypothetical protein